MPRHAGNRLIRDPTVDHDQVLEGGKAPLGGNSGHFFQLSRVFDDRHGARGKPEYEGEFVSGAVVAAGNVGRSEAQNRQIGDKPLGAVFRHEPDVASPSHSQLLQPRGARRHVFFQFAIASGPECATVNAAHLCRRFRVGGDDLPEQRRDRVVGHVFSCFIGYGPNFTVLPNGRKHKRPRRDPGTPAVGAQRAGVVPDRGVAPGRATASERPRSLRRVPGQECRSNRAQPRRAAPYRRSAPRPSRRPPSR
jgi:hypothetical protein